MYDPELNIWSEIEEMRVRRSGLSCCCYGDCIYVLGGFNGVSRLNTGEKYSPSAASWSTVAEMNSARSNFAMEVIDDMILVCGGFNGVSTIDHTECLLVEKNQWCVGLVLLSQLAIKFWFYTHSRHLFRIKVRDELAMFPRKEPNFNS